MTEHTAWIESEHRRIDPEHWHLLLLGSERQVREGVLHDFSGGAGRKPVPEAVDALDRFRD
jgi:hypothetical protein